MPRQSEDNIRLVSAINTKVEEVGLYLEVSLDKKFFLMLKSILNTVRSLYPM